jgi:succinoglycan biosynthesis protein ExoM
MKRALLAGSITITIASSGRPTLARTLSSLAAMGAVPQPGKPGTMLDLDVVIADDSADGCVPAIVAALGDLPFQVRVIAVAAHNVSIARNAALDAATGDLLAMVDDDEWVAPGWLTRLVAALDEFEADCVFGPVHPVYPPGTAAWIVAANPLHVDWGARGRRVQVGRSGNTVLRRAIVDQAKARFDPALGRTGGEDTLFFHSLGQAGAVMVVTDDAIVQEDAPPSRVNLRYFRRRAVRTGQIYARFVVATAAGSGPAQAMFYAGAAAKTTAGLGLAVVFWPFDKARSLRFAMRGWMNLGKLRELAQLDPPHMT